MELHSLLKLAPDHSISPVQGIDKRGEILKVFDTLRTVF
jgi:hypothetical protein